MMNPKQEPESKIEDVNKIMVRAKFLTALKYVTPQTFKR